MVSRKLFQSWRLSRCSLIYVAISALVLILAGTVHYELRRNIDEAINIEFTDIQRHSNLRVVKPNNGDVAHLYFSDRKRGRASAIIHLSQNVVAGMLEVTVSGDAKIWKHLYQIRAIPYDPAEQVGKTTEFRTTRWVKVRSDNHVYRLPMYRNIGKTHILLEIKYSGIIPALPIEKISVQPALVQDYAISSIFVGLIVLIAMFLPGMLLTLGFDIQRWIPAPLPVLAFLITLVLGCIGVGIDKMTGLRWMAPAIFWLPVVAVVVFANCREQIRRNLCSLPDIEKRGITLSIIIGLLIVIWLSLSQPSAINNIHQAHITTEHGLQAFSAHDSLFQYVNARAILESDFDRYYREGRLGFLPQDREILPGLAYASMIRGLQMLLPDTVALSYFAYGIYFLVANALFLIALYYWLGRAHSEAAIVAIAVVAGTPAFWVLAMVGWFKLTGAALMLAGLYVVRQQPRQIAAWVICGVLFGFAKNFHGGNVLIVPLFILWMMLITSRVESSLRYLQLLIRGVVTLGLTVMVSLPWMVVAKQTFGEGGHRLFSIHFLENTHDPASLLSSIKLFFARYPLSDQLEIRLSGLSDLLSLSWLNQEFSASVMTSDVPVSIWLRLSASYASAALLPVLLALLLIVIVFSFSGMRLPRDRGVDPWVGSFGVLCAVTLIIYVFFSWRLATIVWHIPAVVLIGLIACLVFNRYAWNPTIRNFWMLFAGIQFGLLIAYG